MASSPPFGAVDVLLKIQGVLTSASSLVSCCLARLPQVQGSFSGVCWVLEVGTEPPCAWLMGLPVPIPVFMELTIW